MPKVIDFGVAKATGQPLTEHTLHTGFGAVVGTVEYMSPEQVTFNQLDIDTRATFTRSESSCTNCWPAARRSPSETWRRPACWRCSA